MSAQLKLYTAYARGSNVEVFDASTGQRQYTISLGSSFRVTAGPYVNGDILSVYITDPTGGHFLKVFNVKSGTIKYTTNA